METHRYLYIRKTLIAAFHFDCKHGWRYEGVRGTVRVKPSWVLSLQWRKGAGCIGGRTLFVAYNSGSRNWQLRFRGRAYNRALLGFEAGLTRNANIVPYVSH